LHLDRPRDADGPSRPGTGDRCRTSAASWLPVVRCRGRKRSLPYHNPTWVSSPTRLMAGHPAISANRPKVCHGLWQVFPPSPCHIPAWVSGPTPLMAVRAHDDGEPSTQSSHRALSSANRPQRRDHAGRPQAWRAGKASPLTADRSARLGSVVPHVWSAPPPCVNMPYLLTGAAPYSAGDPPSTLCAVRAADTGDVPRPRGGASDLCPRPCGQPRHCRITRALDYLGEHRPGTGHAMPGSAAELPRSVPALETRRAVRAQIHIGAAPQPHHPWIRKCTGALGQIAAAGRLSAFATLVEGLLAEAQLGRFEERPKPGPGTARQPSRAERNSVRGKAVPSRTTRIPPLTAVEAPARTATPARDGPAPTPASTSVQPRPHATSERAASAAATPSDVEPPRAPASVVASRMAPITTSRKGPPPPTPPRGPLNRARSTSTNPPATRRAGDRGHEAGGRRTDGTNLSQGGCECRSAIARAHGSGVPPCLAGRGAVAQP